MNNDGNSCSLEYARCLFTNIIHWYENADSKAQVIFTIDGAFLSFLTSLIFLKKDALEGTLAVFGFETWIALSLMAMALTGSLISALMCIRSRLVFPKIEKSEPYIPEVIWFFGSIALLEKRPFQERMKNITEEDEIAVLSSQIYEVSKNVLSKHKWVNRGFILTGLSLILFMIVGVSYLVRLS